MPFPNWIGGRKRLWTREHVLEALAAAAKEIKGPLPCLDAKYNELKKGRLEWPTSHRILEYFGSMARAWVAVGAPMRRVSMRNLPWTPEERSYILDNAGEMTISVIGKRLRRSYGGVRRELYKLGVHARDNEGYLSAAQMSKELPCSCDRLRRMLNAGLIPGAQFDKVRNRWKIDPLAITPELRGKLTAPRRSHCTWPLDVGDYYARYEISRSQKIAIGSLNRQ